MYGIQSQERRYHYSGIAVPVCWNGGAIPAGIFIKSRLHHEHIQNFINRTPEQMLYREDGDTMELKTLDSIGDCFPLEMQKSGWNLVSSQAAGA